MSLLPEKTAFGIDHSMTLQTKSDVSLFRLQYEKLGNKFYYLFYYYLSSKQQGFIRSKIPHLGYCSVLKNDMRPTSY